VIWNEPRIFYHDKEFFEFAHGDHAEIIEIESSSSDSEEEVEKIVDAFGVIIIKTK
jgi:hypothetical protein